MIDPQIVERIAPLSFEKILKSEELLMFLSKMFFQTYKVAPCCPEGAENHLSLEYFYNKIIEQYNSPQTKTISKIMAEEKKFLLKEGTILYIPRTNEHITNEVLTEKKAIRILTDTPGNIIHFEKVPAEFENLRNQVPVGSRKAAKEAAKAKAAEAVSSSDSNTDSTNDSAEGEQSENASSDGDSENSQPSSGAPAKEAAKAKGGSKARAK